MASLVNDAKQYYNYLSQINQQNNAASQANAREQMAFQERMSNTAHQREIADLKKAGLNPVLTVGGSGGGGASSGSGAMGQVDMSSASALTNYLQSLIQQQTSMSVAQMQATSQRYMADSSAAATRYAANASAAAAKYAADRAYQSQQNFPNTWSGLFNRLVDDTGVRGWIRSKFDNFDYDNIIKLFREWIFDKFFNGKTVDLGAAGEVLEYVMSDGGSANSKIEIWQPFINWFNNLSNWERSYYLK